MTNESMNEVSLGPSPRRPVFRQEPVVSGEIIAGDWHFVFGQTGSDCRVYFKGYEINRVRRVSIEAIAGHIVVFNLEFIPMAVKDMEN